MRCSKCNILFCYVCSKQIAGEVTPALLARSTDILSYVTQDTNISMSVAALLLPPQLSCKNASFGTTPVVKNTKMWKPLERGLLPKFEKKKVTQMQTSQRKIWKSSDSRSPKHGDRARTLPQRLSSTIMLRQIIIIDTVIRCPYPDLESPQQIKQRKLLE